MSRLIKTWEELVGLESDEYYLEIDVDMCNGIICRKSNDEYMEYLSTHTFYGLNYQYSSALLQEYGFDVQLENWDGETKAVDYQEQWLWNGKCEHCRRHGYCNKDCKAAKRWKEHLKTLEQLKTCHDETRVQLKKG